MNRLPLGTRNSAGRGSVLTAALLSNPLSRILTISQQRGLINRPNTVGATSVERIWDVPVTNAPVGQVIASILENCAGNIPAKSVICANPHSLVVAHMDPLVRASFTAADYLVPDGYGLVMASKILGGCIGDRITGMDVFRSVAEYANGQRGLSFFFLGSTENVLGLVRQKMLEEYPNVHFAGCYSPPFGEISPEENQRIVEMINTARPTVMWVGMTAPKQEIWIYHNKDKLDVRLIGAIGAVFDFFAGIKKRSPEWAQRIGLEWLPRLLREPRRLWRRTFISAPIFLYHVLLQRLEMEKVKWGRK